MDLTQGAVPFHSLASKRLRRGSSNRWLGLVCSRLRAHQIRRRIGERFGRNAGRVDSMRCGHRDDSVREGCRRFLEGSHGDRTHVVNDEPDHRALHH